ncbi:titin-like [Eleginops maclovinus]|uniref:titin-like n=1 Tax=Eleginops maclovinus TaxID=56733 RepID=UPI0030810D7B
MFAELFYHKEGTQQSGSELTATRQLRGAFSDTEDLPDHGLVSVNRCSSRTSSISSWTENIKPSFTKKLKFQSVLEGEPVELKCKLVACPQPTILWFHNNKSIPKERRRRIGTESKMHLHTTSLFIDCIREKDAGSYKVMAINTEGSAESTASLLVSLREEQSANYLGFVKRSAQAHESAETMAEQRKERKFRVDLRCVGSPFDKMSKVHQGRSRSVDSLVRTVYFKSGSHAKEKKVTEKESKRLETASERAPSPPPMFDRSERFNDRLSDIYCDRRTGARFSDKFSDRCSDRYSDRFSDTESLHNEVRTKLTTLQKAVKQKKRLSISTMSSSEFESESVASESSYTDYVERLRVKPASLPDVQQFNRPFDSEEGPSEFKSRSRDPSKPRSRHSFEPQSRTRAIQIMRGELVDTMVSERISGETYSETREDKKVESFLESRAKYKQMLSESHGVATEVKMESTKVKERHHEVQYSEGLAYPGTSTYTESSGSVDLPKTDTSSREKFLGGQASAEDRATTETGEQYEEEGAGLRAHYEKSLDEERMQCEEKLLALRIRKWQQGSMMAEEETFHPETDLPTPSELQYMEPAGHKYTQQEAITSETIETEASSFHKSPRMKARMEDPESATPRSPQVKASGEEAQISATAEAQSAPLTLAQKSPRIKARAKIEVELSPRAKARAEDRLGESPRLRQAKTTRERALGEGATAERLKQHEEVSGGESLREQYEKNLDAERMQVEEKLLALRIRKWQHGMRMSEEETPETDLPAETQYVESEGHIYNEQEAVDKRAAVEHATMLAPKSPKAKEREDETSAPSPKARMKSRQVELETEASVAQKSPRIKSRGVEASPRTKVRAEKMLFEKTKEERELQLSRENLSELKSESEKLVSEEEALNQRIMKWQENVLMEQEEAGKPESSWAEGYSKIQVEKTTEHKDLPGKTAKEKFLLSEPVPTGFQDQPGESLQWPPAEGLPTEGRETRLQRDSEYFLSEEEALAQRILKWQQDGAEPEEVAELESEWSLDNQGKQPGSGTLFESHGVHSHPSELPAPSLCQEAEMRRSRQEYAMTVDTSSSQCFQSDVKEERVMREETGTTREGSGLRQQEDIGGVKRDEVSSESICSKQVGEMSAESLELGAIKKDERRVREEADLKEGVYQTSARVSRPVFVKEISSAQVKIGEMTEFTCQFQGDPMPTVTWLKDGHQLAHNPDFDIMSKLNTSKLTVFYPTTDHEGTYDCVITNKHGKSLCSGTLEISDRKVMRMSAATQEVVVTEELKKGAVTQESFTQAELNTYADSGKATLQVPQVVIHKRHSSDKSFSSSPVEIRITAATPLPEMREEIREDEPPAVTEKTSEVPSDEGASQTVKHKFTFSFDTVGEAPHTVSELENVSSISEPVQFTEGSGFTPVRRSLVGSTEDAMKASIIHTKDSIPRSSQVPSELVKAPKSRPSISREPPAVSGCGLQASAAVIKVAQIKQAFESDSPDALQTQTSPEEQREETHFPEEFIPAVAMSLDQQEQVIDTLPAEDAFSLATAMTGYPKALPVSSEVCKISGISGDVEEGAVSAESYGELTQFVEEVQESPDLVRPKAQKPAPLPEEADACEMEMVRDEPVRTFDRTGSFFPFQPDKVPAAKRSVKTSAPAEEAVKPKFISKSLKIEKQIAVEGSSSPLMADVYSTLLAGEELVSNPEPSLDSGVFLSMPESQANLTEVAEEVAGDEVKPDVQIRSKDESVEVMEPEPATLIVEPKGEDTVEPLEDAAAASEGHQSQVASLQEGDLDKPKAGGAAAAVAAAGSMEEEEVTFGAVYDFYNPPTDWGRPLSPESEMSIEIGSTVSEDLAEVTERFYTPGSSTEVSQPIAESFQTPKSHMTFQTPSSDTSGGFRTPKEYPFSPMDHKRPSTAGSSERFFSPMQFLTSPGDEGIETVDDNLYLTKGLGSIGLSTLQEKVQGIPPAFLKPLIKKRVFENDLLTFYAEVFGLPSPEVNWFCNKTQLLVNDRVKIERDGDSISLTIHNVTKADQGEYICEAVNYVGEARSVALVVVVSQEVRFMPAPPAVTHQHVMEFDVEDDDDDSRSPSPQEILLEIELDESEVKEFERQIKIITIPEYTSDNKSMIISLDVLPSLYEEGVVDFVTQEHDDLKIAFEVTEMPPRFINPICDMETPEGTAVMFECSLMGIPSPIVSWFKGDKKIPHNNKKYLCSSDGDNHFLKISKVTTQDSGVYTCRAINVVGETLCRASLVVLNAKAFSGKSRGRELTAVSLGSAKIEPQKFDLVVGNTSFDSEQVSEIELEFEFEQEADESQRAVRLVAKTDHEMSEQGEKYVSVNFDVFAEPAKDDKIEFKGKSSDICSFQFQVTETPPKCVIPLTNITAAVGTPVILQCLVSGKPSPTAEWYKDGNPVTDSRCIIQEKTAGHFNLLITNATQSDGGEYKCIIQNTAGCIETTALLKVF